ncbi:MAG: ATP synthase F1 subunit delta [bacterium]
MTGGEVGRRYAKALAEIAERRGSLDETGAELEAAAEGLTRHVELRRVLDNPRFPAPTRMRLVESVLSAAGASDLIRNFVRLIVKKDRMAELEGIAMQYREIADEKRNRVRAQVRTAFELSGGQLERLRARLSEMTGSEVLIEVERDESLIGGIICRVGSVMMDGSIRNQIKNLREKMVAG